MRARPASTYAQIQLAVSSVRQPLHHPNHLVACPAGTEQQTAAAALVGSPSLERSPAISEKVSSAQSLKLHGHTGPQELSVEPTHASAHRPATFHILQTGAAVALRLRAAWCPACKKVCFSRFLKGTILEPQTAETSSITLTLLVHRRRIPIPHPILAPELHRLRIDKRHVPRERRDGPRRAQLARPFGVALHALNENELRNETHTRRGERERPAPDNGGGSHAGQGRAPGHGSKRLRKLTRLRSDESVP